MITEDPEKAIKFATLHAHAFDAIDVLSDGRFRVRFESDACVLPGVIIPETEALPKGVRIVDRIEPKLPAHIEKIERALGEVRLHNGVRKWPEMSPWWRKQIARAYFFRKRQQVFSVGRRGGKSSTLCRVIVAEVLYGDHFVPGGDTGVFAVVSQDRENAKERIVTCKEILNDLKPGGVRYKALVNEIEIPEIHRAIRVYTASVAGVSGFTAIGGVADELSKWKDKDSEANPSTEVLATLKPTMATMPNAMLWMISSAFAASEKCAHYEAVKRGTTEGQNVFYSPSWVANPTLSEEQTRKDEEDEPTWEREYKSIPMPSEETAFFPADRIDAAWVGNDKKFAGEIVIKAGADLGFRRNSSALTTVKGGMWEGDGKSIYKHLLTREWIPKGEALKPSIVLGEMVEDVKTSGADSVCSDLHYIDTLAEVLEEHDLLLEEFPGDMKTEAYVKLRVLLAQGRISLEGAPKKLIQQLKEVKGKPGDGGKVLIVTPEVKGAHGDLVSALVAAIYNIAIVAPRDPFGPRPFGGAESGDSGWHDYSWELEAED